MKQSSLTAFFFLHIMQCTESINHFLKKGSYISTECELLKVLQSFMLLYIIGCIWSDKLIETLWDTLKTDILSEELDGFPENLGRTFVPPRKSTLSACFVLS